MFGSLMSFHFEITPITSPLCINLILFLHKRRVVPLFLFSFSFFPKKVVPLFLGKSWKTVRKDKETEQLLIISTNVGNMVVNPIDQYFNPFFTSEKKLILMEKSKESFWKHYEHTNVSSSRRLTRLLHKGK